MHISHRVKDVEPSSTLAISARAAEMRASGIDVVNLSAGEPDFPTPQSVLDATRPYFEAGHITYTAAAGLPELRDAVAGRYADRFGFDVPRAGVTITCGAKHALYLALQVLCDDGDEVLFAAPYWVSYPEMARLAGASFKAIATSSDDGFRLDADAVTDALTERTRVLVLNSPSNPAGAVLQREDMARIVERLAGTDVWVLSDEIYDQLYYTSEPPTNLFDLDPDVRSRAIVVNGVSKTYAMTGWRIGYAVGPPEVIKYMTRVQSHETSNANTLAQRAALAALTGDQAVVAERRQVFAERRRLMMNALAGVPGVVCPEPLGAFYLFPLVTSLYGRRSGGRPITGSMDLANRLLEDAHVACVPGSAFGDDAHIRLSYATSQDRIDEGISRIAAFVDGLE